MQAFIHPPCASEPMETIYLGGGCFWCVEASIKSLKGVHSVVSGYSGGHKENPTYKEVCTGKTGHAEVIQVTFDPTIIELDQLLEVFLTVHDPTQLNRQGNDIGTQYRSVILPVGEEQLAVAKSAVEAAQAYYDAPIVTTLEPFEVFYEAEDYHQDYFANNPEQPYCSAVVAPKVAKARQKWAHLLVD